MRWSLIKGVVSQEGDFGVIVLARAYTLPIQQSQHHNF